MTSIPPPASPPPALGLVPVMTEGTLSVPSLVALASHNDHAAFELLFSLYEDRIYNFVHKCLPGEDAADLTQDVFLKAYLALTSGRYAEGERFQAWLYSIALNVVRDEARHRKLVRWERWDRGFAQSTGKSPHGRGHSALMVNTCRFDLPDEMAENADISRHVQKMLEKLPQQYRLVMVLREYHDLSYDEIAEVLNTTRAAVKSLLWRARERCAALWPKVYPEVS